jgi:iron complex transport system ATP-binding protein
VSIEVRDLRLAYGERTVLVGASFDLTPGRVLGVLGPNGSGKSTLVKALAGLHPCQGTIRRRAHRQGHDRLAYLPQDMPTSVALQVMEVVLLGRLHRLGLRVRDEDLQVAESVLRHLGILELAQRGLDELSGGQRQLVFLAQALASEPGVLLLDEPTSALDVSHQLDVLDRIRTLTHARGLITALVLHDLNAALRYCDDALLLARGGVLAQGTPAQVLVEDHVRQAFGVSSEFLTCSDGLRVWVARAL